MSIEKAFRDAVREEVEAQLRPLRSTLQQLSGLTSIAGQLSALGAAFGAPARRGVGRPRKLPTLGRARRTRAPDGASDRPCALDGCKRKARSKGYCSAHYQKFRNLAKTHRLPSDWVEYAPANSVKDVVLPRGRAAAKALKGLRNGSK